MLEKKVISPSVYDEELIKYSKSQQMLNNSKTNLGLAKKDLREYTKSHKFTRGIMIK